MNSVLCKCGCGLISPIAERTRSSLGRVKGQPLDYIPGHKPVKKKSIIWNIDRDELCEIVKNSSSIREVLDNLNVTKVGNYYKMLYKRLEEEDIDFSHIPRGIDSNKGRTFVSTNAKPLEEILVKNSHSKISNQQLKKRLIKEQILKDECSKCGSPPEWNGAPLTLCLDHKNGDSKDNRLSNLRILCPNCHSQTDTFSGRNVANRPKKLCACGKIITRKSTYCNKCAVKHVSQQQPTKIKWPLPEEVLKMTQETNFLQTGKKLGVSDNAIRKYLRKHKLI